MPPVVPEGPMLVGAIRTLKTVADVLCDAAIPFPRRKANRLLEVEEPIDDIAVGPAAEDDAIQIIAFDRAHDNRLFRCGFCGTPTLALGDMGFEGIPTREPVVQRDCQLNLA